MTRRDCASRVPGGEALIVQRITRTHGDLSAESRYTVIDVHPLSRVPRDTSMSTTLMTASRGTPGTIDAQTMERRTPWHPRRSHFRSPAAEAILPAVQSLRPAAEAGTSA